MQNSLLFLFVTYFEFSLLLLLPSELVRFDPPANLAQDAESHDAESPPHAHALTVTEPYLPAAYPKKAK